MAHINQPRNPGENEAVSLLGKAAFCTAVMEPDPKHAGGQRVKRTEGDKGEIVYTPQSLAAYEDYKTKIEAETNPLGPAVSDTNPVLTFYRMELTYQKDPTKPRPRSGPFASKNDIPKDVLKLLESERKR
jgi:hypothetical protein